MSEINYRSFAKISEDNLVLKVLVVDDVCPTDETQSKYYLEKHNNWPSHLWIACANKSEHSHGKAGIGYSWDPTNQLFFSPQPYASWTKDTTNGVWVCPLSKPTLTSEEQTQNNNGSKMWVYQWDESAYQADNTTGWVLNDHLVDLPL